VPDTAGVWMHNASVAESSVYIVVDVELSRWFVYAVASTRLVAPLSGAQADFGAWHFIGTGSRGLHAFVGRPASGDDLRHKHRATVDCRGSFTPES